MYTIKEILGWIILFVLIGVMGIMVLAPEANEDMNSVDEKSAMSSFVKTKDISNNLEMTEISKPIRAIVFQIVFAIIIVAGLMIGKALYKMPGDVKTTNNKMKLISSKIFGGLLLLLAILYPFIRYLSYKTLATKPLYCDSPFLLILFPIIGIALGVLALKLNNSVELNK